MPELPDPAERRLALLLAQERPLAVDRRRLAALGDRLEREFRRHAPRPWWRRQAVPLAAAALVPLLAVPAWLLWPRPLPCPSAMLIASVATVTAPAGRPADPGRALLPGETVAVRGGRAELRWQDGSSLALEDGTELRLDDAGDGSRRVALVRGRLRAEVAPQPAGRPLRLAAAQGEVRVLGTRFAVECDPDTLRVAVEQGRVEVQRPGDAAAVAVAAGEVARLAPGAPPQARTLAESPLRNPGFEQPLGDGDLGDWRLDVRNNEGRARLVGEIHRGGLQSLLLEQPVPVVFPPDAFAWPSWQEFVNSPHGGRGHASVSQHFPVQPGRTYAVGFHWRSQGLRREDQRPGPERGFVLFDVQLYFNRDHGGNRIQAITLLHAGDDAAEWTAWPPAGGANRGLFRVPEGANRGALAFKFTVARPGCTPRVWIDDVTCEAAD
jgi:ferric-dicitrate binding protein FerR (iron transport regulator)